MRLAVLVVSAMIITSMGVTAMGSTGFAAWVADPLVKVTRDMPAASANVVQIDAVANEYASGQIVVSSGADIKNMSARISTFDGPAGPKPQGKLNIVGYAPIKYGTKETPDEFLVAKPPVELPDVLLENNPVAVEKGKNQPVWVTVYVPKGAASGKYTASVVINCDGQMVSVPVQVAVHGFELPDARTLHITNWFSYRHIANVHKVEPWCEPFWKWLEVWARAMADYRQDTVLTPTPQLIRGIDDGKGNLTFDFSNFDRWVELFDRSGVDGIIEGGHMCGRKGGDWSSKDLEAWFINTTMPDGSWRKWEDASAVGEEHKKFLSQYMPALQKHLEEKGWLGRYVQHIADEPTDTNAETYIAVAKLLKQYAPKIPIIDASMCETIAGAIDIWVPQTSGLDQKLDFYQARKQLGEHVWIYTCLSPKGKYMNRFVDYHTLSTRLLHWVNFKYDATGYLHWGLTYWHGDPFKDLEPNWGGDTFLPPGDDHLVYPSSRGPLSSIRWEAMRDGIEDYEMLKLLQKQNPKLASEICDSIVQSFTLYSLDPVAFNAARMRLIKALSSDDAKGGIKLGYHTEKGGGSSGIQIGF
ncbi:MAG: glycoside hydrolase domain-containing protein [Armatimonadota bacterium]